MLRIFSTHRLFAFLLTGLMITSCGGGTSSNTSSGGGGTNSGGTNSGGTNSGGGGTTPQTLTVSVPSLNYTQTITKSTTINDITAARRDLATQCTSLAINLNPFGSVVQVCNAEVEAAYNQAVAFIRN
ncbi:MULTISPECIES: hypothetical protein [Nostocales]|uniref:Uncharacterized protein n=1 Tax=Dolichospermum planctonicum TaxID=136072 RepID=A0A480AQ85_9CYAN|nr:MULTISPECIES: hypothetical protein [Nostocales]MBD2267562.1 hypothetical protein [Anabaena sp. FACHB-1391]GCL44274.1 hypothetical protein NIES80_40010 [Dolichospermum planctonicum]